MSVTPIAITGAYARPDGSPAQGTITATLSEPIVNAKQVVEPTPIHGFLNAEGKLVQAIKREGVVESSVPFVLDANDDAGTEPKGSHYAFVVQLDNAPVRAFYASVPHAAVSGTVDISELEPTP